MKTLIWLFVAILTTLPWLFIVVTGQAHEMEASHPALVSSLTGLAIIGAAFVLSWGAELSERDIPRALALIFLALISVLPEYAIGLHYAWTEGQSGVHEGLAIANMTGANRILIGVGWALVAIVYYLKHGKKEVPLDDSQELELGFLMLATIYSLVIPLKGTLSLVDMVVMFSIFLLYAYRASRSDKHEEPELDGLAGELDKRLGDGGRRLCIISFFAFAGLVIWFSSEPFAEGLKATGTQYGVSQFLLVQWLAPLASESPEGLVALLFALKGKGSTGIGALVSSKVNQWTLLVGALPLVYGLGVYSKFGNFGAMVLTRQHKEEMLLTSAQSFFAAVIIADFRLALWEGVLLLVLFGAQFLFPQPYIRDVFSGLYLVMAIGLLMTSKVRRQMLWRALTFR